MVMSEMAKQNARGTRWRALGAGSLRWIGASWRRRSIAGHIGLVYAILASANLLFFLVMIHENQSDILLQLFRSRTDALIGQITRGMQKHAQTGTARQAFDRIGADLSEYDARSLILLSERGRILAARPEIPSEEGETVSQRLKDEIIQLSRSESLLDSRSLAHLDEKDFSVRFLVPLESDGERYFVSATLNISSMHERLRQIYIQGGIAVAWVFVFHLGFAVYLFRLVIRRVHSLRKASALLADGDLSARAVWKGSGGDELDELGGTFNQMAERIEAHVATIQTLNTQIQKELRIGKTVQALIVNNRPKMEAYHPFVFFRPLREVSGDVFKFYEFAPGMKGVFLGDACGHGVSAALITSLTMSILDRLLPGVLHPAKVLRRLGTELKASLDGMYYTTATFLVLDETKRKLYISNAGHVPTVILRRSNGSSVAVEASGPPAGTVPDYDYGAHVVDLRRGDLIAMYSDGMVEAMNDNRETFGFERFMSLLMAVADLPADQAGERIVRTVESYAPCFHDDATLILLEVP